MKSEVNLKAKIRILRKHLVYRPIIHKYSYIQNAYYSQSGYYAYYACLPVRKFERIAFSEKNKI